MDLRLRLVEMKKSGAYSWSALFWAVCLGILLYAGQDLRAAALSEGASVVVVYNQNVPDSLAVAEHYGNLLDGFIIDESDRASEAALKGLGLAVHCTKTVMKTQQDKRTLAAESLAFGASL